MNLIETTTLGWQSNNVPDYLLHNVFSVDRTGESKRETHLSIKRIIFNDPATIVFWSDGTKTVVKCAKGETFDSEKGVAMAVWKKLLPKQYGRSGKKLIKETEDEVFRKLIRYKKDCRVCEHYRRKDNEILCCMCYISGFDKFKPKKGKK